MIRQLAVGLRLQSCSKAISGERPYPMNDKMLVCWIIIGPRWSKFKL